MNEAEIAELRKPRLPVLYRVYAHPKIGDDEMWDYPPHALKGAREHRSRLLKERKWSRVEDILAVVIYHGKYHEVPVTIDGLEELKDLYLRTHQAICDDCHGKEHDGKFNLENM